MQVIELDSPPYAPPPGKYLILRPEFGPPPRLRGPRPIERNPDLQTVLAPSGPGLRGGTLHLDLETRGLDPLAPDAAIVTLALANDVGCWVWDTRTWTSAEWAAVLVAVDAVGGAAFNAGFDFTWLACRAHAIWPEVGYVPPRLTCCTHVMFRALANEDWPDQRWSLEVAEVDILGWSSHKDELREALARHGLAKSAMWQLAELEPEMFMRYCAWDAEASWQLRARLEELTRASTGDGPWEATWRLISEEWATQSQLISEQQLEGMTFDLPSAEAYMIQLVLDLRRAEGRLRAHPTLAPLIKQWEQWADGEHFAPQVARKRERADKAANPALDRSLQFMPSTAKSLRKWEAAQGGYWYREVAVVTPRNVDTLPPPWNWASDPCLRWLIWGTPLPGMPLESGGAFRAQLQTRPSDDGGDTWVFVRADGTEAEIPLTDTGQLPVGKPVLPLLGEVGLLLLETSKLDKRKGYVASYIQYGVSGRIHPRLRIHGTSTGRASGGG